MVDTGVMDLRDWCCRHSRVARWWMLLLGVSAVPLLGDAARGNEDRVEEPARRIGATATVVEVSTGLPFPARVDTGATSCSIHCEEIKIDDPAPKPEDNVGKPAKVLIKNSAGKEQWVATKIAEHVIVRTSKHEDQRYKVPLKIRWQDVEKDVLVTLNDRQRMKYPMLLGRNFLRGDFVVDVNLRHE